MLSTHHTFESDLESRKVAAILSPKHPMDPPLRPWPGKFCAAGGGVLTAATAHQPSSRVGSGSGSTSCSPGVAMDPQTVADASTVVPVHAVPVPGPVSLSASRSRRPPCQQIAEGHNGNHAAHLHQHYPVSPVVGPDSPASHGPPGVQLMSTCDPVPSDSACNGLFSPQLRLSSVLQPKSYGPRTLRRRRTSEGAQGTPQQRAPIPAAHSGSEPVRSPIPHCPVHPPTASNAGRRFVLPSLVMDGRSWTHGEAEAAAPGRGLPPRCRASVSGPGQHSAPRPTEYWRSCLPSLARQCLQL